MDEMLPARLPHCFFIQGSLHSPHVGASVHIFALWGSVSFNLLIFLVHFLVLLVCIFLMLKLGSCSL